MTKARYRKDKGYALISIMVIGLTAVLFLLGVAQLALTSFKSESQRKYSIELRNAAEAGMDYAISLYNNAAASNSSCLIDPPNGQYALTTNNFMPSNALLSTLGSASNAPSLNHLEINISVYRILPTTTWTDLNGWASIYSQSTDFNKSSSTTYGVSPTTNVKTDSWRILEVTAKYSLAARTIRTVLQPQYGQPPGTTTAPGTPQSYFNHAFAGNQGVTFLPTGPLVVQGVGAPNTTYSPAIATADTAQNPASGQTFTYQLTVSSNQFIAVGPQTDLLGNVQISSVNSNNTPTANVNGGTVEGKIISNGVFSGVNADDGPAPLPNNNILANADLYNPATNPTGDPNKPLVVNRQDSGNPTTANVTPDIPTVNQQIAQMAPAPAQNASTSTQALPDLTNATTLAAGDYTASSLNTAGFSKSVTVGTPTGSVPTRIFLQDPTGENNIVNLSSSQFVNASPDAANLQFWYSGTKPLNINLNSSDFKGLIYAPNATVTTQGNGTFTGSIVAGRVLVNHQGSMNIRTDLGASTGQSATKGLIYAYDPSAGSLVRGYLPVTWQEPQP